MVYRTANGAAEFISKNMGDRESRIALMTSNFLPNLEKFARLIFTNHPELIACIDNFTMQAITLGEVYELTFFVTYTDIMPSAVSIIDRPDSLQDLMLRDVRLHRRYTQIVFPGLLKGSIIKTVNKLTEEPYIMDCFVKGTVTSISHRAGYEHTALQIKYIYSCSYTDYCLRRLQMQRAINEIVIRSKASGIDDWKKAFSAVKYCVENWRYGSVDNSPGLEFTSYGALINRTAVCMGIALAICDIFSELGIPCRYIKGIRNGEGHAWNMIFLLGGWFFIDVSDAVCQHDPYYHWGMTSLNDRTISDKIEVELKCTCPESFIRKNNAE